ncbi:MAG: orotate phosphoribosyltransferase, partial [Acidobacteria bacterium]|nr:orotate phosphoribosyltransferase [Acidobacteriota bacterium]
MHDHKREFLDLALASGVLKLGEFTLKSGRQSPYFFNLGLISSGEAMRRLGQLYARSLLQSGVQFDLLFGPAY